MMISCDDDLMRVFTHAHTLSLCDPSPLILLPVATAAAASKAAAERTRAWREEEARQASLGKSKVDDITNQLKALKAEDRSANPLLQITRTISQPAMLSRAADVCPSFPLPSSHKGLPFFWWAAPGKGARSFDFSKRLETSKTAFIPDFVFLPASSPPHASCPVALRLGTAVLGSRPFARPPPALSLQLGA
jgi:hypothetical protein